MLITRAQMAKMLVRNCSVIINAGQDSRLKSINSINNVYNVNISIKNLLINKVI